MCDKIYNVNGPVSVSYHKSNKYNKEIYIFGENHDVVNNEKCLDNGGVNVPEIYDVILKCNSNKIIDFFVEDFHYKSEKLDTKFGRFDGEYTKNIYSVREYFTDCVINKEKCKKLWKNLRYHSIDRRFSNDSDNLIYELNIRFYKLFYTDKYSLSFIRDEINNTFKNFDLNNCVKIIKQLKNIKSKKVRDTIYKFCITELHELNIRLIDANNMSHHNHLLQTLRVYYYIFLDLLCILVDVYTLARIFRSFGDYNSKYILIHVGNFHAFNYRRLLKTLRFSEILCKSVEESTHFCVDTTQLNLPYFTDFNGFKKIRKSKKLIRL